MWKRRCRRRATPGGGERKKRKEDARRKGRQAVRARPYRRFVSPSGWEAIVGKNAMGNDALLRRVGRASDMWFHARVVPGSHVLLRRAGNVPAAEPDGETLAQAAAFAAYFSRGRTDSKLEVAYLPFTSLRRPKGGRPRAGAARQARDDSRRSGYGPTPVRGVGGGFLIISGGIHAPLVTCNTG